MSTKTKTAKHEGGKDGCNGPTYTEVMRHMYSCYLGDDFMAGVDKLQEEHPQLKPVVLVSSLFSLIPLLCFGVCVAGIFTTNMVLGVFSIKCYRVLCYVPKFENASQAVYYKFEGYSQAMLASFQERFSKNTPEEEDDATVQNSDDNDSVDVYPRDSISQQDVRQAIKPASPKVADKGLFGIHLGQRSDQDKGLLGINLLKPDPLGLISKHANSQRQSPIPHLLPNPLRAFQPESANRTEARRQANQASSARSNQGKPKLPNLFGLFNKPKVAAKHSGPVRDIKPKNEDYFSSDSEPAKVTVNQPAPSSSSPSDSDDS